MRHYLLGDPQEGIGTVRRGPGACLLATCLVPNHYRLLLRPTGEDLSSRMQMFSISFTKFVNTRRARSGVLFQGQFQAVPVCEDRQLLYLNAYLLLNPVRGDLVPQPQDWPYSSYRDYVGTRAGSLPSPELGLAIAGGPADCADFVRGFTADAEQAIRPLLLEE